MITGIEIRNQQFKKALWGYNRAEVDQFMLTVAQDFETVYSQNGVLKDRLQRLEAELQRYKSMEDTMNSSIILAQQTAEGIRQNAQKEAALLLDDYKQGLSAMLKNYQDTLHHVNRINTEIKGQLLSELDFIEKNAKRTEELQDFFYSRELKTMLEGLEKVKGDAPHG